MSTTPESRKGTAREIKRQISYTETRMETISKQYEAKMAEYNAKIADLQGQLEKLPTE